MKECPECQVMIETCSCGVWDCGFYLHLAKDCPSERGIKRREELEYREAAKAEEGRR